jgi:hypothetical protein
MELPAPGDVVRIRESASKLFGGCHAQVKQIDTERPNSIGVQILAPSMTALRGLFWFAPGEISLGREDWP